MPKKILKPTRYKIGPGGMAMKPLTPAQKAAAARYKKKNAAKKAAPKKTAQKKAPKKRAAAKKTARKSVPRSVQLREILKGIDKG